MAEISEQVTQRVLGGRTRDAFARDLLDFAKSSNVLLTEETARRYGGEWVAAHNGKVVAHNADYDKLLGELRASSLPIKATAIKYIGKLNG
jgi:hypothetical protein